MNSYRPSKKALYFAGLISMAMPIVSVVVLLFLALHHTIIFLKFDAQIPSNQLPGYLHAVALCLGLAGTLMLWRNHIGRPLASVLLWVAGFCLLVGFIAIAIGLPPGNWLRKLEVLDLFSVVFPLSFMAYLAFLTYCAPRPNHELPPPVAGPEKEAQQTLAADASKASRA
jgi:hypothetical protein